jgi:hypothetical protein
MERMHKGLATLLVLAGLVGLGRAETFTIAVIPDTQRYSDVNRQLTSEPPSYDGAGIFHRHTQWIADNAADRNIVFATQLGDLWQHYGQHESEMQIADAAMYNLNGALPYAVTIGNHDYDVRFPSDHPDPAKRKQVEGVTHFDRYFGPDSRHFAGKQWYRGSFRQANSYQVFEAGGREFLNLSLEMEPDDEVLAWAQSVMDEHTGTPAMLSIHQWVGFWPEYGDLLGRWYRKHDPGNGPQEVFDKFVTKNPEIFLVVSGHAYMGPKGDANRVDLNDEGLPVWQYLIDYQGRENGGNGWLRLIEFDTEAGTMTHKTWSTELLRYTTPGEFDPEHPGLDDFTVQYDLDARWAVPEPTTMALLGLGGLLTLRRRRN